MNKENRKWCTCKGHDHPDWTKRSSFYTRHFIPDAWELEYRTFDRGDPRILYQTGTCRCCGGFMRSGVSVASNISGNTLLAEVYRQMKLFRPYDGYDQKSGRYFGCLTERTRWYQQQDDLTLEVRNNQFLQLFRPSDQEVVRGWLSRHHAAESYTAPRRDRISTLFRAVLEQARAEGSVEHVEAILDYVHPNNNEPILPDQDTYLTDYHFNIVPALKFGNNEGIYLVLYLEGSFDSSDRKQIQLGTFKTLRTDMEACSLMGALGGILLYYAYHYVNLNIHRYTPLRDLEREYAQQKLQNELPGDNGGGAHG